MTEPSDFSRLDSLLDAGLDQPKAERARWIAEVCGGDAVLRERLCRLIALAESDEHVLPPSGGLQGAVWEDVARELDDGDPELRPGHRLGRYEVRGVLGVGGMGRVYCAFDPMLAREVAMKSFSPARWGGDGELRRRFEREARLLATLNHPNIAAIYGFELIDGAPFLVLERIEGITLAKRLERGALSTTEAVALALQITAAIEEAHAKGIVHRDLKPSNVMLGPEGRVKVLDFGIAKPPPRDAAEVSATPDADGETTRRCSPTTRTDAVFGTAPYMSPEQVRGDSVDTRTDVWAFGCLLYEMLCGRPAFTAPSRAEVMASVLRDEVDWSRLPPGVPAGLRRLLRRCLRRDPRERLQSIGDARLELSEPDEAGPAEVRPAGLARGARLRSAAPWAVAAVLAGLLVWSPVRRERAGHETATRLGLELPAELAIDDDFSCPFAIAPNGRTLVVRAARDGVVRLFRRDLDRMDVVPLEGTEGAWQPFFSPDGQEVAFFADRKLKRVSIGGGPSLPVTEIGRNPRGGCWGPDGTIVLASSARSGLTRVDAAGAATPLTQLDMSRGDGTHRWPQTLPGGRWVLFTASLSDTPFDEAHLEVVSLSTGERRTVLRDGSHGRYAEGRLFFVRAGRLFAVPFDLGTLTVRGTPAVVLEGVRYDVRSGSADFALADDGTLVYRPAPPTSMETYLAWVDERGTSTRIGDTAREFHEPHLSPDGRRLAVRIGARADSQLWILETERATFAPVSLGRSLYRPVWRPDGRAVTVASPVDGRWRLLTFPADGARPPVTVYEGPRWMFPCAWTPDGRSLVFQELRPDTTWDLRALDVGADGRSTAPPRDVASMPFPERNAAVSPDGRRIAFEADEPDSLAEVYVASLADPGTKVRVTVRSGRWPRWGREGQLYYWVPTGRAGNDPVDGLHRIDWRTEGTRHVLERTTALWPEPSAAQDLPGRLVVTPFATYDVDLSRPDPRFLVLEAKTPLDPVLSALSRPVVVLGWLGDLRDRGTQPR